MVVHDVTEGYAPFGTAATKTRERPPPPPEGRSSLQNVILSEAKNLRPLARLSVTEGRTRHGCNDHEGKYLTYTVQNVIIS
jgi:hypothetical protein